MSEITRTEKFLRACIDGEPCALKPLTRVEKLLAELNDKLAGGPSEVVILPETELEPMSGEEGMFFSTNPLSATPTAGATAKVEYNGAEYECSVLAVPEVPFEAYALGNAEMMGIAGGNADAPFLVMLTPSGGENDSYTTCVAMDEASSVTLSIVQVGAASGGGAVETMHVNITSTDGVYKADKPFATVLEAVLANKPVEFRLNPGAMFEYRLHLTGLQRRADGGDVVIMNLQKFAGAAVVPYAFMADESISVGAD